MSNENLDIVWDDEQEDFDVLSDLQRTLPGVGITSGYRTPEYQEELRRRGYNPAQNSDHLYGDAIDIGSFPGMTLAQGLISYAKSILVDVFSMVTKTIRTMSISVYPVTVSSLSLAARELWEKPGCRSC